MTQEFHKELQLVFDNIQKEDIEELILNVINTPIYKNGQDDGVYNVVKYIREYRQISFAQWKLLNAFYNKQHKPTFKSF